MRVAEKLDWKGFKRYFLRCKWCSQYFREERRYFMIVLVTFYAHDAMFLLGSEFPFGYVTRYYAGVCRWEEKVVGGAVNCGCRLGSEPANMATWLVLLKH
jgi:hypothetical protein